MHQIGKHSSKSCCSSRSGHGEDERKDHHQLAKQSSSTACCSSCAKGGPCESGRRGSYQFAKQTSKACCSSCAKGGVCEGDRRSHYQSSKQSSKSSCSSQSRSSENTRRENPRPTCCRFKYREVEVKPYRKCGVIPNYMGYIPGKPKQELYALII
ncbi:hypothetical protein TNIN_156771 [Trichonephila inaurata madagascariensis]|uniref:Uncharacterized protein n=1 Tax=Trichonephila inaurata madagascariensis TaxID=2747483 RepID=A0A8X7C624_9ARAC|nr:hypothetical protein TNIN_156771 [Trichonephila inaurata madagascariensis]